MFSRIAVVNRGEAAMRLIHAVRDINAETGSAIQVIALYTDADATAMFVRESDVAYPLGPAGALPYLDFGVLERALRETGADAAWVGWGFVAEDPAFAELCARIKVTFIGPGPDAMRRLGDKIGSKLLAAQAGVPVAPWSEGEVGDLEAALAAAAKIGYPVMLKASAGGGGRGIRMIRSAAELEDAYQRTRDEAARAFGRSTVFLEKLVTGARHVEVQIIADAHGTVQALGVRDCSVQRRNQKVIEESSSPVLNAEQNAELKAAAERLAKAVGYRGAGTVEFLYHPAGKFFAFLEVNTRLQVEHPITEVTTDTDLVKALLHVAAGGRLEEARPPESGHAIEARLNAEDPDRDFAPSPGRIALLEMPAGPGIRVDTGVGEGDTIPSDFDSMIAKIIARGRTRAEALGRLRRALAETTVIIEGGTTNKSFLLDLLDQPEVIDGSADTGWIDRVRADGRLVSHKHSGIALVAAGIAGYEEEKQIEVRRLLDTAHGGRPQVQHRVGRAIDLTLRGAAYQVAVTQTGPQRYQVTVASGGRAQAVTADVERLGDYHLRLTVSGRRHRLVTATHGTVHLVEVDGVTHRVSRDEGGVLRAPTPALVVSTPVAVGDEVAAGAPVLVLESMKMETLLSAPFAAKVRELLVSVGSQVETGAPLLRLEPSADGAQAVAPTANSGVDLDLPAEPPPAGAAERAERGIAGLKAVLMGYDLDGSATDGGLSRYLAARDELAAAGTADLAGELSLVRLFADFAELTRNRLADEELHVENRVHSPREHFHAYLQSLDAERSGIPDAFRGKLERVLGHYGLAGLERSPALEEAVFRVFLAQRRSDPDVLIISSVLQRWLDEPRPAPPLDAEARDVLDRLVLAAQLRFPVLGDLARSVRFRWFDQPLVDTERASVLDGVPGEIAALAAEPDSPGRARRIDALAEIPEPLVRFLAERLEAGVPEREPMLEVLVKRHYREYALEDLRAIDAGGRPFAVADYVLDGRPTHLVSTVGTVAELSGSELPGALADQVARRRADQAAVVDAYLSWPDAPHDLDEQAARLAEALGATAFAKDVRRVAVAACLGGGRGVSYFTFRPGDGGLREDHLVRGVHPMVGRRLSLWRLRDFDIARLDSSEDVLLYRATARANASDQRLIALAQVRQLAVVRDEQGRVSSVPQVERAIANCVEAIRRARTALAGRGGNGPALDMNHVWVQIWPVIEADLEQLTAMRRQIAPLTVGAGIEEVLAGGRVAVGDGEPVPMAGRFYYEPGLGVEASIGPPPAERLKPLDDYHQKVLRARRRGTVYPYELHGLIAGPGGMFTEYDLDDTGELAPVGRPPGLNKAGIVVGLVRTPTAAHPEGVTRVSLAGDPLKALGAVSEAECSRIIAALDLAEELSVPVEWFALSSGARISMDSGTENMDWVARVLKRIIEFTQGGGEINVVVAGINVGAQPYWNAEATMLMHTKGILVMTPESAMVLTGKQSLDFSGGVSAEDNFGIGGYDRVMGPNGQAQYWAADLAGACDILMAHYEYAYAAPGEDAPRRVPTTDPADRDVTSFPHAHADSGFATIGDIFSPATNPDRKKAFDIRTLMRALADQDLPLLERWPGMADADTAVVQDAYLGGYPVCLLGIESRSVPRRGFPPTDGPDTYTAGTLFPRSSKKAARAINAASGNRPLVVLANLSGFDGSPDSMRHLQLEYGAEIGRAVVNFSGPIVFCVISRYHGGAFVVFSKALNPRMTVLAVEGSFASVIGGAPAAAVVFARDVEARTAADPRVRELEGRLAKAPDSDRVELASELVQLRTSVRAEKLGEVAAEFDGVHDIYRAVAVGSVDEVISASELRPRIIGVLGRGTGTAADG